MFSSLAQRASPSSALLVAGNSAAPSNTRAKRISEPDERVRCNARIAGYFSFHSRARGLDHRRPALGVLADEGGELARRHRRRLRAAEGEALLHLGCGERAVD